MKLGSLKGARDGRLVVVSRDLAWCADATHIAPTLQAALDDWDRISPQLENLSTDLAHEAIPMMRFHERQAEAPLPRAFQRAEGSAYLNHVELVMKSRGDTMPDSFRGEPLLFQGASDRLLAPRGPISLPGPDWGCDFAAEVVVVTADVPRGATRDEALGAIRLVGIANGVTFHDPAAAEFAIDSGVVQPKSATALSPVLVTPDELGDAWADGKLHGVVAIDLNNRPLGRIDVGVDMSFDFGTLVARLARTRDIGAGSVIGSGAVSNRDPDGGASRSVDRGGSGYGCITEQRSVETIADGAPTTPFLRPGDTVRVRIDDDHGHPVFGTIEQMVTA